MREKTIEQIIKEQMNGAQDVEELVGIVAGIEHAIWIELKYAADDAGWERPQHYMDKIMGLTKYGKKRGTVKIRTADELIREEIKEEMCDRYCKYPLIYKVREEAYQKSAEDMLEDRCRECPLNRL